MSLPIWTPAALASEARAYGHRVWRLVEAQHRVSTLKLVDTLEEQALLEDLIEATKPVLPPEARGLDYLLATPFRYDAPYPVGSRFRRAGRTPGVFYAAERPDTALAEMAFYRLLFFAESPATPIPRGVSDYTAFSAAVKTEAALDLTDQPLLRDAAAWCALTDYAACQSLAEAARSAGIGVIRYQSVRDPRRGANVALLTPAAFAAPQVQERQTWRLRISALGVLAVCDFPEARLSFPLDVFAADPRLSRLRPRADGPEKT